MNKGRRIEREDTHLDENGYNLEDYTSNMNDMRWYRQRILTYFTILQYFDEDSIYYHRF